LTILKKRKDYQYFFLCKVFFLSSSAKLINQWRDFNYYMHFIDNSPFGIFITINKKTFLKSYIDNKINKNHKKLRMVLRQKKKLAFNMQLMMKKTLKSNTFQYLLQFFQGFSQQWDAIYKTCQHTLIRPSPIQTHNNYCLTRYKLP
jgi:hypothetical protein